MFPVNSPVLLQSLHFSRSSFQAIFVTAALHACMCVGVCVLTEVMFEVLYVFIQWGTGSCQETGICIILVKQGRTSSSSQSVWIKKFYFSCQSFSPVWCFPGSVKTNRIVNRFGKTSEMIAFIFLRKWYSKPCLGLSSPEAGDGERCLQCAREAKGARDQSWPTPTRLLWDRKAAQPWDGGSSAVTSVLLSHLGRDFFHPRWFGVELGVF